MRKGKEIRQPEKGRERRAVNTPASQIQRYEDPKQMGRQSPRMFTATLFVKANKQKLRITFSNIKRSVMPY